MTLDLFEVFEEEEEGVEVFAKATMIDIVSLAARLCEGETEPTPAGRMLVLLAIDDAGRAGRRGAGESMASFEKTRDEKGLLLGDPFFGL